ncbi:MAG: cation-transporting P-type ATPase [Patescibacteria group bacterium]|nr:cation-transporting P-type ATPase [Patescibacteria group bacterium]
MNNYSGLSAEKAKGLLAEFGPNQIYEPEKISFFGIARHEVTEPMILLLLVVGVVYSIWGKLGDAITIFAVIFALVFVEVYNEFRAKKAITALGEISAPKTKVWREGKIMEIDLANVVPGDLLVLITGTKIAADAKITQTPGLEVDESALTGESFAAEKKINEYIYAGTTVTQGEGMAEVADTGKNTKIGKIASIAKQVKAPRTPLQLAMRSLAGKLVYVAIFFSILIPVIGFFRGQDLKMMILIGLSLAFAVIPEELPIVITMVLGLGSYTLSRHNFLVKKLKAAETLGNATVILTDKTGTITESKMKIVSLYPADRPQEIIRQAFSSLSTFALSALDLEIISRAEEMKLGEPGAIKLQRSFGDGRKTRSVIRQAAEGFELIMSGAPEEIFSCCADASDEARRELSDEAGKGRRVIAIAVKKIAALDQGGWTEWEKNLDFVGLIGFEDPPRAGVEKTIAEAARAGIRTIMVTGDHPLTAAFVAAEVGIALNGSEAMTGQELDGLSDSELQKAVKTNSVFARATPEHKYRLVQALQKNGEVVAVTGDGINDALALKGADIGIAMGIRGTDVAKEAAEVVLADDNYVTIAKGIFEGRKFFDNLQKGIKYYLSVKAALIMIFLLPAILAIPLPFAPIQIIILELFMDLAASSGFVSEPAEKNIYTRPPRDPKLSMFSNPEILDVLLKGAFLFVAVIGVYFFALSRHFPVLEAQTMAFSAWIIGHIALAFVSRAKKETLVSLGFFSNKIINLWGIAAVAFLLAAMYLPVFSRLLNLEPLKVINLIIVAAAVIAFIGLLEIRKIIFKK